MNDVKIVQLLSPVLKEFLQALDKWIQDEKPDLEGIIGEDDYISETFDRWLLAKCYDGKFRMAVRKELRDLMFNWQNINGAFDPFLSYWECPRRKYFIAKMASSEEIDL